MTRLKKKKKITPQQPQGLLFSGADAHVGLFVQGTHTCFCTHTYTGMHAHPQTRKLWKEIKCFNQLATAHNEDPSKPQLSAAIGHLLVPSKS